MKILMWSIPAILFFIFCIPFFAMADTMHLESQIPTRCGPKCIIETEACTTQEEALEFAKEHHGNIYRLPGNDVWFVDYQVSEDE